TYVVQAGVLDPTHSVNPVLVITSGFRMADADIRLALQAQPSRRGGVEFDKRLTGASGALIEQGSEHLQGSYWEYKLSGRASWKPTARDSLNLNAQVIPSRDGRHTFSETFHAAGARLRTEDSKVVGDRVWSGEIGTDWEHRFSPVASFKLVGLASRKATGSSERYTVRPISGGRRDTLVQRASRSGEYVGRGVFTWKPARSHSLDVGGEAAFNYLDSRLAIAVDLGAGPRPSSLPVADTRIEERRGEVYVTDFWQVSETLKLETSLSAEFSRISQSGDAAQERDFTFFKPRMNLTWSPEGRNQLRLLVERDVAQLDFTEFASAVSLFDGIVDLGNPDLQPERTWRAQVDWEHRFATRGVLIFSAFHDRVSAVQDQIPIAGQFDGPGNIGKGRRSGLRADLTAPLDAIGIPRGELRLNGLVQNTRATDPVTGRSRRFSEETEWNYSVDIRQPLPGLKLLWGVLYERTDSTQLFRLREQRTNHWDAPSIDLFVESTAIRNVLVRFTVADILRPTDVRERRFFTPDRTRAQNLTSVETRAATGGFGTRSYTLRVSGRF
ncbi:TonB-dependent receptor plug domain-containing protein, partial [Phenylobacterium sp.]|uniref:TonB-dependent receptor plug domain-containing protein n=1 Tax=Phenylobacterium sp. TaxID=1871053 RepID=UPI0037CC2087